MMQTVTILGSTGSIGKNTLDVIARHPERYRVFALTGFSQIDLLLEQAKMTGCRYIVLADDSHFASAKQRANELGVSADILCGKDALDEVASAPEVDVVMAAIVGAAGLSPSLAAARAGKKILLANKEALVMSGQIFIDAVNQTGASVLPIDSEHNAIFQCLPNSFQYGELGTSGIDKILLTGSGGPFRERDLDTFDSILPEEAVSHPNWSMGQKISVDSATMMNKGLEYVEACRLFGMSGEDLEVVLHPQSIIHSMVQYVDGSILAQMGQPDMRTPIAHGLAYPERIASGAAFLNFAEIAAFTFEQPDFSRYPNLELAIQAEQQGQCATTALNAANEVAVAAFLEKKVKFTDIYRINAETLNRLEPSEISSLQQVLDRDALSRRVADKLVDELAHRE